MAMNSGYGRSVIAREILQMLRVNSLASATKVSRIQLKEATTNL
jgi:hypothetical protein